ncbi:MAG: DUF5693 family protein [Fimbriimonadaceae bacterium]|jgi:hypothetical protein|nr:DUF5693 family protein [Fimbriimonadaceae bacterium]
MKTLTTIKTPWWIWVTVAFVAAASLYSIWPRFKAERENRAVGLAYELTTIRDGAAADGTPLPAALRELKEQGLTGVVLVEDKVSDLVLRGQASLTNTSAGTLVSAAPHRVPVLRKLLKARFGEDSVGENSPIGTTRLGFIAKVDGATLGAASAGIDSIEATAIRQAGLILIVRHGNSVGVSEATVRSTLQSSAELGATAFLPLGDQVLGNRELLEVTQEALRDNSLNYLSVEFGKIIGDGRMINEIPENTIRFHTAQQVEIDRLSLGGVTERYAKAFRERNIRWLLLRPVTLAEENPLASLKKSIQMIKGAIIHEGGGVKEPRPFAEPLTEQWIFPVIGVLLAPLVAFAFYGFFPKIWWAVGVGLLFAGLGGLCWFSEPRPYVALAGAVALPMVGFIWGLSSRPHPVLGYLLISVCGLVGGLCVSGLLVGLKFMIQADQFSGVKLAHFGPILLVGLFALIVSGKGREVAKSPAQWGTLVGAFVLTAGVAFMLSRTGNDNPAGVSDLELRIRSLLDAILFTRPRTKEFLIGHPALIVGLGFLAWSRSKEKWFTPAAICLTIGAIGQASVVNTLCHLHSPIDLGLIRIGIGHLLGAIIGVGAWLAVSGWYRARGEQV